MASCRNWHTSRTQNAVPARACGFESHRGHILEESSEIGIGPVSKTGRRLRWRVSSSLTSSALKWKSILDGERVRLLSAMVGENWLWFDPSDFRMTTNEKGQIGLIKVMNDLVEKDYHVFLPICDIHSVDLICMNKDFICKKLQIKYKKLVDGAIHIPLQGVQNGKRYSTNLNEIDYIYD
jgi:hypothetical protein